jgi:hypothetical protein
MSLKIGKTDGTKDMMRSVLTFCSLLALGVMTAALMLALLPWMTGRAGEAPLLRETGLHLESLLLGIVTGLLMAALSRYNWSDIPRRLVMWFLVRERQFFYYTLIGGCLAVLVFY